MSEEASRVHKQFYGPIENVIAELSKYNTQARAKIQDFFEPVPRSKFGFIIKTGLHYSSDTKFKPISGLIIYKNTLAKGGGLDEKGLLVRGNDGHDISSLHPEADLSSIIRTRLQREILGQLYDAGEFLEKIDSESIKK